MIKKAKFWIIFSFIIIFVIAIILFLWFHGLWVHSTSLDEYLRGHGRFDTFAETVMPELSELPPYHSISYRYDKQFFGSDFEGMCLVVEYDAEVYETAKELLESKYAFFHETYHNGYYDSPAAFTLNNYQFRIVDIMRHEPYDGKYIPLIAYNDMNCSVVYLFYYDELETIWSVDLGLPYTLYGDMLSLRN